MAKVREDSGLIAAIKAAGGVTRLAEVVKTTAQNVCKWKRIPAERVIEVEHATGIPREKLRPDIYAAPRPKRSRPTAHA